MGVTKVMNIMQKLRVQRPSPLERRLQQQAMLYWHATKRDRDFVPVSEFDPLVLEDRSSHGFLLDLTNQTVPLLRYIGPILRDEAAITAATIAKIGRAHV